MGYNQKVQEVIRIKACMGCKLLDQDKGMLRCSLDGVEIDLDALTSPEPPDTCLLRKRDFVFRFEG